MDFVRSYFNTNEPLTCSTLLSSLFFQISTRSVRTKVLNWSEVHFTKVTSYTIHILVIPALELLDDRKIYIPEEVLNPDIKAENINFPENMFKIWKDSQVFIYHDSKYKITQEKLDRLPKAIWPKFQSFVQRYQPFLPSRSLMPYPCSHFYFDIKFGDRLYSKENRPGSPLLF